MQTWLAASWDSRAIEPDRRQAIRLFSTVWADFPGYPGYCSCNSFGWTSKQKPGQEETHAQNFPECVSHNCVWAGLKNRKDSPAQHEFSTSSPVTAFLTPDLQESTVGSGFEIGSMRTSTQHLEVKTLGRLLPPQPPQTWIFPNAKPKCRRLEDPWNRRVSQTAIIVSLKSEGQALGQVPTTTRGKAGQQLGDAPWTWS